MKKKIINSDEELEDTRIKLSDAEFEYKVAKLTKQDEEVIKYLRRKVIMLTNKLRKLLETNSNEQK